MPEKRLAAAGNRRFLYLIAAPALIAMLATAIVISAMLAWSAKRTNQAAFARQEQLVALVLGQSVSKIAHNQESITYWDDPVLKLREPTLDQQWLDDNIGVWLYTYFGHDQVYVVDPTNRPVYAMQAGKRVEPSAFLRTSTTVAPLVDQLRRTLREDPTAGTNETVLTPGPPTSA